MLRPSLPKKYGHAALNGAPARYWIGNGPLSRISALHERVECQFGGAVDLGHPKRLGAGPPGEDIADLCTQRNCSRVQLASLV